MHRLMYPCYSTPLRVFTSFYGGPQGRERKDFGCKSSTCEHKGGIGDVHSAVLFRTFAVYIKLEVKSRAVRI